MKLDKQEKKMLIAAAKMLRQVDKDAIGYQDLAGCSAPYGTLDKALIRKWNALIKKLKAVK